MQKFSFTLFTIILLISCLNAQENSPIRKDSNRIEVVLTNNLTREVLMDAKKELWDNSKIILDYNTLEFGQNGKIKQIKISVDCQDGFKGSYWTTNFKNNFAFGFYRDYNEGVSSPFGLSPYPFESY